MKGVFFLFTFFLLLNANGQESDTVNLGKGTWISGVEGGISNTRTLAGGGTDIVRSVDYLVNFNSGLFLSERFSLGLNLKLTKSGETRTSYVSTSEELYLGPWFRYYIPLQYNWYLYPELGASFVNYYSELYEDNNTDYSIAKGQGLGINPGIGVVYFVSKTAAFSIRWNYQWNIIKGEYELYENGVFRVNPINNYQFGNSSIFFGFQLYINEFFF